MAIRAIHPGRNPKGKGSHTSDVQAKTAAAITRGAPLVNSGGSLVEDTTPSGTPAGIVGISAEAKVAADASVRFYNADQEFEATLRSNAADHALAQADLYATAVLTSAAGASPWHLDLGVGGADEVCIITGFKDAIGTTDARVYFVMKKADQFDV